MSVALAIAYIAAVVELTLACFFGVLFNYNLLAWSVNDTIMNNY
jgi:hypothetical protein